MRRRITFSRNVTLSLARTWEPDDVEQLIDRAARRGVKELLVLTGDDPGHHPGRAARLAALGFDDIVAYVVWCCERALDRGLLPHTNLGVLSEHDLGRLREVTASQGLMLETMRADLVDTIRAAGALRIPFTSGILVGIGETEADRMAALEALASTHAEHGHLQEVVLQNVGPHPGYHSLDDMKRLIAEARRVMPGVAVQIPPNLVDWWPELVAAGASDLGGLSTPHQARKVLAAKGWALTERLSVYPQFLGREWIAQGVLDVIKTRYWSFIPRRGSGRTDAPFAIRSDLVGPAIERGHAGKPLTPQELTAMFAETRSDAVEAMREAANELRLELAGETVTFVVNRNINISNVCIVGCAFCGFGQGRRSPDAYTHDEEELRRRVREAVDYGATEICMQSGIHPDWGLADYEHWLRVVKDEARGLHLHAYSPMEVAHMCDVSGLSPTYVFERLREAGLGSTPGTAAEVLHDGVRERISPNKLPVDRWVEVIESSHAVGLRSTATVMFGHIEEPWELAEHMRVIRELQERTGGFTEFVPLSFIPFHTLLGRTHGIEEISREENLKHTAVFRLALGRRVRNLQASWVKMGLDVATEALRWGVNDLGGTLMEENISRLAGSYHGVRLDPPELIAAAHAAGRPAAERTTLYELRREYPVAPE